jgi:hypothetical protein
MMPVLVRAISAAAILGAASPLAAQGYPFSQRASLSQHIAFTEITIAYGRPVARGRTLFPDLVKWNRAWNPGADSATRLTISRDVEIEGRRVSAGEYSLWIVPRASAPWTVILSRAAHVFHTPYPGESHDALRVDVAPESGGHMETLAFYFPAVIREDAVLRMHWGTTIVPLRIRAPFVPDDG